ncbi:aminodeoxychorismate/anthranilate synthase component II [bacterium]|nr:aminodeoxychorismate/anthranilate synthase component II [bacterium]
MILLIDNYDSFTYNLVQYFGELGADVHVIRNDELSLDAIKKLNPERLVISPGPCTPKEAGVSVALIKEFYNKIPILGVCLGHQALAAAFGGEIVRAPTIMHGKTSEILHDGKTLYQDVSNPFIATRYHSLIVDRSSLSDELEVSSWTEDGVIMGLRHKKYPVEGVQFHPESILTEVGHDLLRNFLDL